MKKVNIRKSIYSLILVCVSLLLTCMIFLPGGKQVYMIGEETVTNLIGGLKYTFGGEIKFNIGSLVLKFNAVAFLGFTLPLFVTILYFILDLFLGNKANLFILLVVLSYIISILLLMLSCKAMININELNGGIIDLSDTYQLGIGSILGAIFSTIGLVGALVITYVKLVKQPVSGS